MIEITYLNNSKEERHINYDNFEDFKHAQFSCSIELADHYKVTKLVYNGHELDYHDVFGNVYFYLSKLDLTQYD